MPGKGRAPAPTAMKEMRGNPGKRAKNTAEPKPDADSGYCPGFLVGEARAEWQRISKLLLGLGLLTKIDRTALAAYCQAHCELWMMTEILNKEGRLVSTWKFGREGKPMMLDCEPCAGPQCQRCKGTGQVQAMERTEHPAVKIQHSAMKLVKAFLAEFGLTPSSRARLQVEPPAAEKDEFEDFLAGKVG